VQKWMAAQAGRASRLGPLRPSIRCRRLGASGGGRRIAACRVRAHGTSAVSLGLVAGYKNLVPPWFPRRLPGVVPEQSAQPLLAVDRGQWSGGLWRRFPRQGPISHPLVGAFPVIMGGVLGD
jgi:hypothetical protein